MDQHVWWKTVLRLHGLRTFIPLLSDVSPHLLAGSLGGYTGVFLGCSFITFMEFLVYFGLVVAVWVNDVRTWLRGEVYPIDKDPAAAAIDWVLWIVVAAD